MTQTCFCSVSENKSFFCTQRKAVTEHRYLTRPCRRILIQWEQGRVIVYVCSGPEVTCATQWQSM